MLLFCSAFNYDFSSQMKECKNIFLTTSTFKIHTLTSEKERKRMRELERDRETGRESEIMRERKRRIKLNSKNIFEKKRERKR